MGTVLTSLQHSTPIHCLPVRSSHLHSRTATWTKIDTKDTRGERRDISQSASMQPNKLPAATSWDNLVRHCRYRTKVSVPTRPRLTSICQFSSRIGANMVKMGSLVAAGLQVVGVAVAGCELPNGWDWIVRPENPPVASNKPSPGSIWPRATPSSPLGECVAVLRGAAGTVRAWLVRRFVRGLWMSGCSDASKPSRWRAESVQEGGCRK